MDTEKLIQFVAATLILLAIPGPDMLAIVSRGIQLGKRSAVMSAVGYAVGDIVQTILVALGVAAFIRANPSLLFALRLLGSAYLIYLGVTTIVKRKELGALDEGKQEQASRNVFCQSVIASVINPKTALFFVAFLPQFVAPALGHEMYQILVLGSVFTVVGLLAYVPVALLSSAIGRWMTKSQTVKQKLPFVSGGILVGLGVFLAVRDEGA